MNRKDNAKFAILQQFIDKRKVDRKTVAVRELMLTTNNSQLKQYSNSSRI